MPGSLAFVRLRRPVAGTKGSKLGFKWVRIANWRQAVNEDRS